jgi:hypothetical protein
MRSITIGQFVGHGKKDAPWTEILTKLYIVTTALGW